MSNTHSAFLKEMGITEWSTRDGVQAPPPINTPIEASPVVEKITHGHWWFFGTPPQGNTQILFQSLIRSLGLGPQEWSWKNSSDDLNQLHLPGDGIPVVALAFGGSVAQKITGEKDSLPQLRETILALDNGSDEEIPVIASFDLAQLLAKPKDKSLLWQDLLLAKSVLQNI